ncbi:phosphate regulon sensor protein PhoR [Aquipluma nitroreducens]|uniref:histidine kinase n=1 Tax=Aquipluma nitroreducens TaxID=2010828 RepID=A0A5K7SC47_9BACT|nr:HAMP domain-containing sensor histidine kinase [Aquipluma nitroreducens]BBE19037.1 phosphate regulon sensor protein PhoR [Aquipluma nitroreducens]
MNQNPTLFFSRLYWKISALFIMILVLFAGITLYISVHSANNYSIEVNQKLNWNLAATTVSEIKPEFQNGTVNKAAIADIMHSMMVINPSLEVYLLDPEGKILSYVAPAKVVKLENVSLAPIESFLNDTKHNLIFGDDPRNLGEKKTFSAAKVIDQGRLTGYIYIVLASQEYISAAQMVIGSYILGLSIRSIIIILIISAFVGLFFIWFITKKLNTIVLGIREFQSGNLNVRIPVKNKDELDNIGLVFNEMAGAISKSIRELKETDEFRKELISNVSHDLRTPVASIQGYAETLLLKKDRIAPEEQTKYLEIIYASCERLKTLVSELFELSKLQTNQVKLNPEPFSIAELVSDIANKYRIISQKKGISINAFIPKENTMVEADILLIDRVLQNLIDNAIRFCREGDYINIEIISVEEGKIEIKIADSGEGINADELPFIFERYYKGKKYSESTGLGLAIVKKIIDLHHSDIQVFSQPGKGTTFTFQLPAINVA